MPKGRSASFMRELRRKYKLGEYAKGNARPRKRKAASPKRRRRARSSSNHMGF
jgi:hypothetical protein